ncbi:hypothetical protein GCM10010274_36750 [Streptomyces lavendofoliae]|uniref:Tetratricopeptide repeat protein n=2 Tax=Streptomyces lavendofoliae TaxID=67314 RepID=A0A918HYY8_9ACTN|nr:hypothetical protein GCM10010274_36750 [Streptomyces lavendofoliae]
MREQQQDASDASEDAVLTRIGQTMMLLHGGDREEARNRFGRLWEQLGADGDPLQRCTLAHCMADAQDDPYDELAWDLRALTAAEGVGGGGHVAVRALYPSLHLNLAADYVKLRRPDAARIHLDRARAASATLDDDRYGAGVRAAIARLAERLAAE